MTTETQTPNKRVELPADLLERVDEVRGSLSRAAWLAQAAERKLEDPATGPVVDLDEMPERDTVRFGGKQYELVHLDEFGIVEQQKLNRDGKEFSALFQSEEEISKEEEERLLLLSDRIFEAVLDAPEDVRAKFNSSQRTRTVLAFTFAPARRQLAQIMEQLARQQAEGPDTTS